MSVWHSKSLEGMVSHWVEMPLSSNGKTTISGALLLSRIRYERGLPGLEVSAGHGVLLCDVKLSGITLGKWRMRDNVFGYLVNGSVPLG